MYQERMMSYYPQVIQAITDFQAIIDAEYPEIEDINEGEDHVLEDAWLTTMKEDRIEQWEQALNIKPLVDSTVEDRRETIVARIRGKGKLNTELINSIVSTFTNGTAESYIENSVLYVKIKPPTNNKQYKFENVEQEIGNKVPAHIGLVITRDYSTWQEVMNTSTDWSDFKSNFSDWEYVKIYITPSV